MKDKHFYDMVFFAGFLIWFLGSWHFGWNETAQSVGEKYTDLIGALLMFYGGMNSFVRGIKTEVNVHNHRN